ncbi:MAG TPA: response regulator transcription factor [Verrucomicrobiae bacterium]|nr:response regulator transcription factor [Verrucomicrobiae bacterium]
MNRNDNRQQPALVGVVIIEDGAWMRENLELEINRSEGLRCLKSYRTAEQALRGIVDDQPDVVIVDINLPGMDGVECVRHLKSIVPKAQCLMLTVYEESEKIFNSLLAGASGYLLKRSTTQELVEAIRQVREGGSPMSSSIARKIVAHFHQAGENRSDVGELSPREQQVLDLMAKGASSKEIASLLSLSIETIRMNVKHIYAKLHVHSRGEATAKYLGQFPLGFSKAAKPK